MCWCHEWRALVNEKTTTTTMMKFCRNQCPLFAVFDRLRWQEAKRAQHLAGSYQMLHLICIPRRSRLHCACSRILQRAHCLYMLLRSTLDGVIVFWFIRLTSRLGGLACPGCHLPACQPGHCTSPSSHGRWLCPQSGSEGSAQAPRPPEASAHLHQSTPPCSRAHCLTLCM